MKKTLALLLTYGTFYLGHAQITYTGSPTYTTNQSNPTIPKKDSIQNPSNTQDKSLINQDLIRDKNMNRADSSQNNQNKGKRSTGKDSLRTKND